MNDAEIIKSANKDVTTLVQQIMDGTIEESKRGTILKSLQVAMSTSILQNLSEVNDSVSKLKGLCDKLDKKLIESLDVEIDSMTPEFLLRLSSLMMGKRLSVLDMQRKIFQGKDLFPDNVLSDDERMVVKLFKSFGSEAEKKAFMKVVKQTLNKTPDADFDEK